MNLQVNDTGTLLFGDNTTAKVKIVKVEESRSGMFPTDYWFWYLDDETNRKITHPDFSEMFPLPEGLVKSVFVKDVKNGDNQEEIDEYHQLLESFLSKHILPENQEEARKLFKRMERIMSKEEIIETYFSKK